MDSITQALADVARTAELHGARTVEFSALIASSDETSARAIIEDIMWDLRAEAKDHTDSEGPLVRVENHFATVDIVW